MQSILLASKSEPLTNLFRVILTPAYSVKVVFSGEEAIAEVNGSQIDYSLLILDSTLPPIRGHEVIDQLCEHACPIPIILASGRHALDTRRDKAARVALLAKPFRPAELLMLVEEMATCSKA